MSDDLDVDVDVPVLEVIVTPGPTQQVTVSYQPSASVTVGSPTTVNMTSTSTELVTVEELGIVGQQGPPGPPGRDGTDGSAPEAYQLIAVGSWTWTHDYGYPPEVRLVDENNEIVEVGVDYPDAHTVSLTFPQPFTGTVYLS